MSSSIITEILKLSGGRVAGRVRIQKMFYLLDKLGIDTGFEFEYHHYGPYSEGLSSAIFWAEAEGELAEKSAYRASDGARYSVFELSEDIDEPRSVGGVPAAQVKEFVSLFEVENATVLELAATALWLKTDENLNNWEAELFERKAKKVTPDRVLKAKRLLQSCGFVM
jgi:uncharacterized protein YwgA